MDASYKPQRRPKKFPAGARVGEKTMKRDRGEVGKTRRPPLGVGHTFTKKTFY